MMVQIIVDFDKNNQGLSPQVGQSIFTTLVGVLADWPPAVVEQVAKVEVMPLKGWPASVSIAITLSEVVISFKDPPETFVCRPVIFDCPPAVIDQWHRRLAAELLEAVVKGITDRSLVLRHRFEAWQEILAGLAHDQAES